MKIALPTQNNSIDNHFGHCEYYTIFSIDTSNNKIINTEQILAPAGCGCKSNIAEVLSGMGVKLMLAGNMGEGAVNVLKNSGIDVIRGCSGDVNAVATKWLEGSISDSGDSCREHDCN